MGKPEEKEPLRRPRRRWEDNIRMDLQEVECEEWAGLIRLRIGTGGERALANAAMKPQFPRNVRNSLTSSATVYLLLHAVCSAELVNK